MAGLPLRSSASDKVGTERGDGFGADKKVVGEKSPDVLLVHVRLRGHMRTVSLRHRFVLVRS